MVGNFEETLLTHIFTQFYFNIEPHFLKQKNDFVFMRFQT